MAIYIITDDNGGSVEGFFKQEEEAQNAANARVTPAQMVEPGEFCVCGEEDFRVYSEILDPAASLLGDRDLDSLDEDERAEYDDTRALYAEPHMRFYRFTRSYSVACPRGELGDRHLATVLRKLTKEEFEAARKAGWP